MALWPTLVGELRMLRMNWEVHLIVIIVTGNLPWDVSVAIGSIPEI